MWPGVGKSGWPMPRLMTERPVFLERYAALLAAEYPAQADGKILLPYPRLFFIASKAG